MIHFTYLVLRVEIGTGRDERVHHRRVPLQTGVMKRCVAILYVGDAWCDGRGAGDRVRRGVREETHGDHES